MSNRLWMRGLLDGLITRYSCSYDATCLTDNPVSRIRHMLMLRDCLSLDFSS